MKTKRKIGEKPKMKGFQNGEKPSVFIKKMLIEYCLNLLNCHPARIDFDCAVLLIMEVTGGDFYERVLENEYRSWIHSGTPLTDGETKNSNIGLLLGNESALLFLRKRFSKYLSWQLRQLPLRDEINDRLSEMARASSLDGIQESMMKYFLMQKVCPLIANVYENPTEEDIHQLTGCDPKSIAKTIREKPYLLFLGNSLLG